ncbi:MAG: fluoride efflux transporter CrcB, partial [Chitinophagaceae bacterium]|nr:fluoride efflux transporter CrcB [Chitinophagaceae bacterium]
MIKNILLVGLGGGLGSMLRYLSQRFVSQNMMGHFPWGTFAVNITGCFLIGIFWGLAFKTFNTNEDWKLFLMVGLCGGFTTFSAFTLEGIGLLKDNKLLLFLLYVGGSVLVGLLATFAGMR